MDCAAAPGEPGLAFLKCMSPACAPQPATKRPLGLGVYVGTMDFFKKMGQSFSAATVLDASTKVRMNPLQLRKAGVIIQNMQVSIHRVHEA